MDRRANLHFIVLIALLSFSTCGPEAGKRSRWAAYYSGSIPLESLDGFDLLVLDCDHHPPLEPLIRRGKLLLGYLSLGEVEQYREHFAAVKSAGLLLQENQVWKGSYFIDLRDGRWGDMVAGRIVPAILKQGFHGIFLDTLDNAVELERSQPDRYAGMREAAAALLARIRREYPGIRVMLNRAYELLPVVEEDIDFALGESVYSTYDFESGTYRKVPEEDYLLQVRLLREARMRRPSLKAFTLDYWDPADQEGLREIYRVQRTNGFEPYVATIRLDRVVLEPK